MSRFDEIMNGLPEAIANENGELTNMTTHRAKTGENGKMRMTGVTVPVILHPAFEGGYSVDVPDFEIGTQGNSIEECIEMAREAIGLWCACQQEAGKPIPMPSVFAPKVGKEDIVILVDVDLDAYRRKI